EEGTDPATLEDLLRPQDRRGLDPVGGEHAGGGAGGPVVDHHGHVARTGRLQPGRDPRGSKPEWCGNAHGATSLLAPLAGASLASGGWSSAPGHRNGAWGCVVPEARRPALCGVRPGACGARALRRVMVQLPDWTGPLSRAGRA